MPATSQQQATGRRVEPVAKRATLVMVCFWLLLLAFAVRVCFLTLSRRPIRLLHYVTSVSQSPRGRLLDRNGQVLAVDAPTVSLYLTPQLLFVPRGHAGSLADRSDELKALIENLQPIAATGYINGANYSRISNAISRGARYVSLVRLIDPKYASLARSYCDSFRGLGYEEGFRRVYPHGAVAMPVMGYVGLEGFGMDGVEAISNRTLMGGRFTNLVLHYLGSQKTLEWASNEPDLSGHDVQLTIDVNLQIQIEELLASWADFHAAPADWATMVVLDYRSGEVLAMASLPTLDASEPLRYDSEYLSSTVPTASQVDPPFHGYPRCFDLIKNWSVANLFEPNNTISWILYSDLIADSALARQLLAENPDSMMLTDQGPDWERFKGILRQLRENGVLTPEAIDQRASLFDLCRRTGINLPHEYDPIFPRLRNVSGALARTNGPPAMQDLYAINAVQLCLAFGKATFGREHPRPVVTLQDPAESKAPTGPTAPRLHTFLSRASDRQIIVYGQGATPAWHDFQQRRKNNAWAASNFPANTNIIACVVLHGDGARAEDAARILKKTTGILSQYSYLK